MASTRTSWLIPAFAAQTWACIIEGFTAWPAVMAISEAPGELNKVVSVVQKGYRLGDRVIRPAMVIVGKGDGESENDRSAGGDEQ